MNLHNIFLQVQLPSDFRGNDIIEAGITKPPEVIVHIFFLSLCLFLSLCFHAIKGIRLKPTQTHTILMTLVLVTFQKTEMFLQLSLKQIFTFRKYLKPNYFKKQCSSSYRSKIKSSHIWSRIFDMTPWNNVLKSTSQNRCHDISIVLPWYILPTSHL